MSTPPSVFSFDYGTRRVRRPPPSPPKILSRAQPGGGTGAGGQRSLLALIVGLGVGIICCGVIAVILFYACIPLVFGVTAVNLLSSTLPPITTTTTVATTAAPVNTTTTAAPLVLQAIHKFLFKGKREAEFNDTISPAPKEPQQFGVPRRHRRHSHHKILEEEPITPPGRRFLPGAGD